MKKKTALIALITVICFTSNACAQWVFLDDPFTSALHDPSQSGAQSFAGDSINLIASGFRGVVHSTDNGLTWDFIDSIKFRGGYDYVLLSKGKYFFIGGLVTPWMAVPPNTGFFRSSDYGKSWTEVDSPQIYIIYSLVNLGSTLLMNCSYSQDSVRVIGRDIALRSIDEGLTWSPTDSEGGTWNWGGLSSFALLGNVIIGGTIGPLFRSYDGIIWNKIQAPIFDSLLLYNLIANNGYLFAGTNMGILRSNDTGLHWDKMYSSIDSSGVSTMIAHGSVLYVIDKKKGLIRSTDTGETWDGINTGITGNIQTIYVVSNYLFVGTTTGIWRRPFSELEDAVAAQPQVTQKFSLLTNPTTSSADFQFSALQEPAVFELFDALGRSFLRRELPAGQASLHVDMQSYPAGIYFAQLGGESCKVIKN